MTKQEIQRISDAFSAGIVQKIEEIVQRTQTVDIIDPLTQQSRSETGSIQFFTVTTSKGRYVLVGHTPTRFSDEDVRQSLKKELQLTFVEFLPTSEGLTITHKLDLHWSLIQPYQKLNHQTAQSRLQDLLIGKEMWIEVGYGGILFIEIGNPLSPKIIRASDQPYREMSLFTDELWEIWYKGKKVAARFEDETIEEHVTAINGKTISGITIQPSCARTFLSIGDYTLVMFRTEQLTTWDLSHREQNFRITLTGRRIFEFSDYFFEKPTPIKKKHRLFLPDIYRQFYKENMPISLRNVLLLIQPIQSAVVEEMREYGGIKFCLPLKNDQEWLLCVDSEWSLHKKGKEILSSTTHRFHYAQQLEKYIVGKRLINLEIAPDLATTTVTFSDELILHISKAHQSAVWTLFNQTKNYHIDALSDGHFEHIIICPDVLKEKYMTPQLGSSFAHCIYALDLYRELITQE